MPVSLTTPPATAGVPASICGTVPDRRQRGDMRVVHEPLERRELRSRRECTSTPAPRHRRRRRPGRPSGATLFELRAALDGFDLRGEPACRALATALTRLPADSASPEASRAGAVYGPAASVLENYTQPALRRIVSSSTLCSTVGHQPLSYHRDTPPSAIYRRPATSPPVPTDGRFPPAVGNSRAVTYPSASQKRVRAAAPRAGPAPSTNVLGGRAPPSSSGSVRARRRSSSEPMYGSLVANSERPGRATAFSKRGQPQPSRVGPPSGTAANRRPIPGPVPPRSR